MIITELAKKQKLVMQLMWGEQMIEFYSSVVACDAVGVYITPYVHQGKPLSFDIQISSGVVCNMFTDEPETSKRISWNNVELKTIEKDGQVLYYVTTNGFNYMAREDERRKHGRTVIRKNAQIFNTKTGQYIDILVHDISDIGISFYAPATYDPPSNQVTIILDDTIDERRFRIKVECSIVRTSQKAGTIFRGCKIVGENNKDYLLYGCIMRLRKNNKETADV